MGVLTRTHMRMHAMRFRSHTDRATSALPSRPTCMQSMGEHLCWGSVAILTHLRDATRRGRFWFHYGLLGLITLAIVLASMLSFAFYKLRVPLKGFGEGEFKPVTVVSQAIAIFDLFIFLLYPGLCKRCVMMLQCKPVVGPNGRRFFLGIDMSMGCADDGVTLNDTQWAAMIFLIVTILIPAYGSQSPTPRSRPPSRAQGSAVNGCAILLEHRVTWF